MSRKILDFLPRTSGIKVTGYDSSTTADSTYALLQKGAVSTCVDANSAFKNYFYGYFDSSCSSTINHAVVLVGYGTRSSWWGGKGYWIVRNSWGVTWGWVGHIYIYENAGNNGSCNVERFGIQPRIN